MAYDRYKDSNGVWWTVAPPDGAGWFMVGYVADEEQAAYQPPPPDQMARTPAPEDVGRGVANPTPEQVRVIFLQLVQLIEAYAKEHRTQVVLRVTAHSDAWGWLIALGLLWLAMDDGR